MGWFRKFKSWLFRPQPVSSFFVAITKFGDPKMRMARVRASWTPSVSTDVESQTVSVVNENDGTILVDETMSGSARMVEFEAGERVNLTLEVTAFDGTYHSVPASVSFNTGDFTRPMPPTNLRFEIVEITTKKKM